MCGNEFGLRPIVNVRQWGAGEGVGEMLSVSLIESNLKHMHTIYPFKT